MTSLVIIEAHNLDCIHWVSSLPFNHYQKYLLQPSSLIHSSQYILRGRLIVYEYLDHPVARNQELCKHVLKLLLHSFILFIFDFRTSVSFYKLCVKRYWLQRLIGWNELNVCWKLPFLTETNIIWLVRCKSRQFGSACKSQYLYRLIYLSERCKLLLSPVDMRYPGYWFGMVSFTYGNIFD